MIKNIFVFVCLIWISFHGISQAIPDSLLNKHIIRIDSTEISTRDFLWFYNKYNSYLDTTQYLELEEYLDLFVEYKMKVLEAEKQQLDTSQKFKQEFYSYIQSTANNFLYNKDEFEKLKRLEYERFKTDYEIAHIFIRVNKKASPKDTLAAYEKALKIKKELQSGANFEEYAKKYSDDTFTKESGGYLGYITGLFVPLPYENAIYNAKKDELIGPIATSHGYYITKILNKRNSLGKARASLIVVYPETKDTAGWQEAKRKIDSIHYALMQNADWNALSDNYNLNQKLKANKGDLGWIDNVIKYDSKLKEVIFALPSIGNFSSPIQFDYGYVICKLTGKDSLTGYDTYEHIIERMISQDESRKDYAKKVFYAKQKNKYSYKEHAANIAEFVTIVDNTILLNKWIIPSFKENKVLFWINSSAYTYADFASYLFQNQKEKRISDKEVLVRTRLQEYAESILEQKAIKDLAANNIEFSLIMQEYHDGMIIYELLNKEIFQKAVFDTLGLQQFYYDNLLEYMKGEGVLVSYYTCKNQKVLKKLRALLNKQQKNNVSDVDIVKKMNAKHMENIIYDTASYYQGQNAQVDKVDWIPGTQFVVEPNKIGVIKEIIPNTPIPFEHCKNIVTNDYQNYLESEWLYTLHKTYSYTINQEVFNQIKVLVE